MIELKNCSLDFKDYAKFCKDTNPFIRILFPIIYHGIKQSYLESEKVFPGPADIKLSEDYIQTISQTQKVNLNKNLITRIVFAKDAVYFFYFNKVILFLKKNFKTEEEWKTALDFIKMNYVTEQNSNLKKA